MPNPPIFHAKTLNEYRTHLIVGELRFPSGNVDPRSDAPPLFLFNKKTIQGWIHLLESQESISVPPPTETECLLQAIELRQSIGVNEQLVQEIVFGITHLPHQDTERIKDTSDRR